MIRHWCEAMGDGNAACTGPDAVAPPTMLQVWTMGGLSGHTGRTAAQDELFALLDGAGYTSVVATEFSKDSGRSELKLAVEAVRVALDDAGLSPSDVDGMVTFTMDTSPEISVAQAAGKGGRRPAAVADLGARPGRHRRRHHLRPLHSVRADATGGVRLLRARRGAGFVAGDALPLNTHGGRLGEAYLHGMNGIAEAVRQLCGTSVNQIPGAATALVTAGTGVPTSGLVLGAAPG
jgi:hypothetical protein